MNTTNKTKGLMIAAIIAFAATIFTACVPTPGGGGTNPNIIHKNWNLNITSKLNWNTNITNYLDINNDSISDIAFHGYSGVIGFGIGKTNSIEITSAYYFNDSTNALEFIYNSSLEPSFQSGYYYDKAFYIKKSTNTIPPNPAYSTILGSNNIITSYNMNGIGGLYGRVQTDLDGTAYSGLKLKNGNNIYYGWIKYQIVGIITPLTTDFTVKILETAICTETNKIILAGQK
jgi:hypothetical protein